MKHDFVGSKSGQKQTVKFLQNMVSKKTQQLPTPSQPDTVFIYCTFPLGRGGGVGRGVKKRKG
jgi:hypothetical protein